MANARTNYRNNLQSKQELNQKRIDSGYVSDVFPRVAGMVILMTYYQKPLDSVLMVRTVNVFPTSYAYFHMQCMIKGCDEGGYDLAPVIKKMVNGRKKKGRGRLACKGKGDNLPSEHSSVDYEITIRYRNRSQ